MNLWKPTALVMTSAFALLVGYSVASANPSHAGDNQPKPVAGDYYNMRVAMEHLRAARWSLATSEHNHGGWRERAIEATDRALYETRVAMDY